MNSWLLTLLYVFDIAYAFWIIHYAFSSEDAEASNNYTRTWFDHGLDLWKISLLVFSVILLPAVFPTAVATLLFTPPVLDEDSRARSVRPRTDRNVNKKKAVKNFIIRITTRGTYPKILIQTVRHNSSLIEEHLDYQYFGIHIVTETDLNSIRELTDLKHVDLFLVPSDYVTENGTLYRARNLVYWMEHCCPSHLRSDDTCVLSIDEDVLLTESFMEELKNGFFQQHRHVITQSPTTVLTGQYAGSTWPSIGWVLKFLEYRRIVFQMQQLWFQLNGSNGHLFSSFHGGCYVVRANVEREIGYDVGPFCSLNDDVAFGQRAMAAGRTIYYLNGYYMECAPPDLMGYILQRGRWFRGHFYVFLKLGNRPISIPFAQRFRLAADCFMNVATVFACIAFYSLSIICVIMSLVRPSVPRISSGYWIVDLVEAFSIATWAFMPIYGSNFVDEHKHLLSAKIGTGLIALIGLVSVPSAACACYFKVAYVVISILPEVACSAVDFVTIVSAIGKLIQELCLGTACFSHTAKKSG